MADNKQVNSSTDGVENSNKSHLIDPTSNVEKTRQKEVLDLSQKLIKRGDSNGVLEKLVNDIKKGDMVSASARLEAFTNEKKTKLVQLYEIPKQQGETLLHLAIKSQDNIKFVTELSTSCPDLLLMGREQSHEFRGQTALHMAITKGNKEAIEAMLEVGRNFKMSKYAKLLNVCATGSRFVNTVMMGQLPLTVAALVGDTEIVDLLLKYKADLHIQNKDEDTVFHSLVKYAATYPEKVTSVIKMMRHLHNKIESDLYEYEDTEVHRHTYSFLWFLHNKENLTPLQLAARYGVTELFEEIINLKDVYCYISANDGLFDVKEYDVTEIDTVSVFCTWQSEREPESVSGKIHGISTNVLPSNETSHASCCSYPEPESILEMLIRRNYDSKDAYRIIELPPVQYIIQLKWDNYKYFFILWMIFHYAFMILLTMYSVYNVELGIPSAHGNNATTITENFVYGFRWVSMGAGAFYGIIASSLLITKFRKKKDYFFHNMEYIIPMIILSITMIIDVLWSVAESHDNIPLIIALICGWWLNVFFLSPFKKFSFFTELIKRVITGDLFRFGLVILFELISFTAGMYIVFRGTDEEDFSSYGSTMMAMFKLGIGIDDINVLYSARIPWAAVTIFIIFTTFTYLLMLNALIAMMSQTCSNVVEERFPQWRIQQLSVVLVIEEIMCFCCFQRILSSAGIIKEVRGLDPITKQRKVENRYFLEIHSLQMAYATAEEKNRVKKRTNDGQVRHRFSNVVDSVMTNNEFLGENIKKNGEHQNNNKIQTLVDNNLSENKNSKEKTLPTTEFKSPTSHLNVDKETSQINAGMEPSASFPKNFKKVSEDPDARQKHKKQSSKSQKKKISEIERESQDQSSPIMNSSTGKIFFSRPRQNGLKTQEEKDPIEYDIRSLTSH